MESDVKISPQIVRGLRLSRGWSQDQLSAASGVSLRTIQRVESTGSASNETRMSLAATFAVRLGELAEAPGDAKDDGGHRHSHDIGSVYLGIALLTCVLLNDAARLPGTPTSLPLATINALFGVLAALLALPAAARLLARRHYAGVALAALGTPCAVFPLACLLVAAFANRTIEWQLGAFGLGGLLLMAIALRSFRHPNERLALSSAGSVAAFNRR